MTADKIKGKIIDELEWLERRDSTRSEKWYHVFELLRIKVKNYISIGKADTLSNSGRFGQMPYYQQMRVMNVLESDVIFQSFEKWCREECTGYLPRNHNQTVVENAIAFGK